PRLEDSHRRIAVAELRALVLALDDDARRQVGDADRRVGGVDPLAPGAGGPEDVHPDLVLPHADLHVVHLRDDRDRREARLPTAPGWIARIAALASWGPDIMTFSSNSSRSLRRLATSAAISASRLPSSASAASSRSTVRSSARATSSFSRPTFRLSSVRSRMRSWARRLSSQKAGDAISA